MSMPGSEGYDSIRLALILVTAVIMLFQAPFGQVPALAANFSPNAVLEGLLSTCGLLILVAGGVLGARMFFKGQMVQAVVAVVIAAFIFVLLSKGELKFLGDGIKDFLYNPGSDAATTAPGE